MNLDDTWIQFNMFGGIDILSADGKILIRDYNGKELQEDSENRPTEKPDHTQH